MIDKGPSPLLVSPLSHVSPLSYISLLLCARVLVVVLLQLLLGVPLRPCSMQRRLP